MVESNSKSSIDPNSGFCSLTKIFHTLKPIVPLPPEDLSISVTEYAFSLCRNSPSPETTALIDSTTADRLSYREITRRTETLAASLQLRLGLSRGDTAFIISPACVQVPILYLSLLSIGVVISPANPTNTESEISRQIELCKPVVAFATSATAPKIPPLRKKPILIDSLEFESMMTIQRSGGPVINSVEVSQLDTAAILYSSGTTGPVKGVMVTYRNLINIVAGVRKFLPAVASIEVMLFTVPLFHVYGISFCLRAVAVGETLALMQKFDLRGLMSAIEKFRVTAVTLAPPVVVALMKDETWIKRYDLSSLKSVVCGGAPIAKETMARFKSRFPNVILSQGYGLTECPGGVALRTDDDPGEGDRLESVGRLSANIEAKIVDPSTGIALPPCTRGELWVRGPMTMKGYIGDDEATSATLDSEGWLRTGDLCYIDEEGYLFVVDRLKELIKYKGYQVPPVELEKLLQSHPDVIDAAVIPYPNKEAGQVPMAFVVRRDHSTLNEAQVMAFVAKQVAPYKKIRRVSFVHAIPKNPAGKILRRELIKLALSNSPSKL